MNKPELVPGSFFERGSKRWREEKEKKESEEIPELPFENVISIDEQSKDSFVRAETNKDQKIGAARDRILRVGSSDFEGGYDLNEKTADLKRLRDLLTDAKLQLVSLRSLLEKRESLGWYQLIAKREVDEDVSSAKFEINSRVEALNDFDIPNDLKNQLVNFQKELNFLANDKNTKPAGINKRLVLAISLSSQLISGCGSYIDQPRPDASSQDSSVQVVMDGEDSKLELPGYSTPTDLSESPTSIEMPGSATAADLSEPATEASLSIEENKTRIDHKEDREKEQSANVYFPDKGVESFKYWRRDVLHKAGLVEEEKADGTVPTTEAGFNVAPGTTFKVVDKSSGENVVVGTYEIEKGGSVWGVLEKHRLEVEKQAKINGWEDIGFEFSASSAKENSADAQSETKTKDSKVSADKPVLKTNTARERNDLSEKRDDQASVDKKEDVKKAIDDFKEKSTDVLKGMGLKPATPEQMVARKQRLEAAAKAEDKDLVPAAQKSSESAGSKTEKQPEKKLSKAEIAAKKENERKEIESNKKADRFARNAAEIYKLEDQIKSFALGDARLPAIKKKLETLKKVQAEQQGGLKGSYKEAFLKKASDLRNLLDTGSEEGFQDMLVRLRQELAQSEEEMKGVKIKADILNDKEAQKQVLAFEKNSEEKRQQIARLEKRIEEIRAAAIALNIAAEDKVQVSSETTPWSKVVKNIKSSAHGHLVDLRSSRDAYLPEAPEALENGLHRQESSINSTINARVLGIIDLLVATEAEDDKAVKASLLAEAKLKLKQAYEVASIQPKLDKKVEDKLKELSAIIASFEGNNSQIEKINKEREDEEAAAHDYAPMPSKGEKMLSYSEYSRQINKNKKHLDRARHRLTQVFNKDKKSSKDEKEIEKLRLQIDQYEAALNKAESSRGKIKEQARLHVELQKSKIALKDLVKNGARYNKEEVVAKLREIEDSLMDVATDWRATQKDDKEADRVLKQVNNAIEKGGDLSEIRL